MHNVSLSRCSLCSYVYSEINLLSPIVSQAQGKAQVKNLGAVSIRKKVLPGMAIPMLKIRRPNGRLIFNMEIAISR